MGTGAKRCRLCGQLAAEGASVRAAFYFNKNPARYNRLRMDGRFVRANPQIGPNRPGRQITGDRMTSPHGPFLLWALTKEEDLIIATGALLGVVVVGGVIFAKVDRWRKRQMEDRDDGTQRLSSFREMYEAGELSKAEYDRVLRRIAEQAKIKAAGAADREQRRLAGLAKLTVETAEAPEPPAPTDDEKPPAAPPG